MFSISTQAVAADQRLAFWTDVVCARLVRAECAGASAAAPFQGRITQWATPDGRASVSRVQSQAQRVRRHTHHIAGDGEPQVLVNIQRHGVGRVVQDGREAVLQPGDLAVYTSERPYQLDFQAPFEQTVLILPAEQVRACVPDLSASFARRVTAQAPGVAVLGQAAREFVRCAGTPAQEPLAQAMIRLLAASLGREPGRRGEAVQRLPRPDLPSARERQVLELLARGLPPQDIATCLDVALTTVRTHLRSLYAKLGAHTQTEAVYEARQAGWIE